MKREDFQFVHEANQLVGIGIEPSSQSSHLEATDKAQRIE
jgi:hypothetical protein